MSDYRDQVTLARLYEKTSAKGSQYFVGRLGMAKIAVLKSKDAAENGDAIWNVVISEAQTDKRAGSRPEQSSQASSAAKAPEAISRPAQPTFDRVMPNEDIPF